jgi:flagellar assembly protein FliH
VAARRKSLPDRIYKSGDIDDEGTELTIQKLGPEEEFAKDILTSLKDKISEARERLHEIEDEIEEKTKEAENRKEEILDEARSEAQQIKEEAEQEAQELIQSKENEVENAREEGYEDGYQDGENQARKDMAELVNQAQTILQEAKHQREAYLEKNTRALIDLAGEIAHKVVRQHVEIEETTVTEVVESALDEVADVQEVTVVLSPEDAEEIQDAKDRFIEEHPNLTEISISQDSKMERGGCRIRTNYGDIQGTLRGQIEHLTETLIEQSRETATDQDNSDSDA